MHNNGAYVTCCNGCVEPKRHIGCHGTCSEYIEQYNKHQEFLENGRKKSPIEEYFRIKMGHYHYVAANQKKTNGLDN